MTVILRGAELVLTADREWEAPRATYVAECLACGAESGLVDYELNSTAVWAIEHAREWGAEHGQFLVTTRNHWFVRRHRPAPPVAAVRPPQEDGPGHGRRRRGGVLAGVVGAFRRWARA